MVSVNVVDVLDGQTLMVVPEWHVNGSSGSMVRVDGLTVPPLHLPEGQLAKCRMTLLVMGSPVQVGCIHGVEGNSLRCDVHYNGLPMSMHFPQYAAPFE